MRNACFEKPRITGGRAVVCGQRCTGEPPVIRFSKAAFCIPLVSIVLAGCGYERAGNYDATPKGGYQWHSLYREDVQTVSVPIFTNKDFRRGVEQLLQALGR